MDVRQDKGQGPGAARPRAASKPSAQSRTVYRQARAQNKQVPEEALAAAANSETMDAPPAGGQAPAASDPGISASASNPASPAASASAKGAKPARDGDRRHSDDSVQPKNIQAKSLASKNPEPDLREAPQHPLPAAAQRPVQAPAPAAQAAAPQPAPATQATAPQPAPGKDAKREAPGAEASATPNFDLVSKNIGLFVSEGAKALSAALEPLEKGETRKELADGVSNVVQSFGRIAEFWLADPKRTLEAQKSIQGNFLTLWAQTLRRLSGEEAEAVVPRDPTDKRFAAPQWSDSPIFDFLRQAHAITTNWAEDLVARAETTDPHTREKARFYLRQISSALSPSNFIMTNPELLRETLASNAENLVRGAAILTEDIEAGRGTLRIRQSDSSKFELGINMAVTPGKVIYRNDLIELIQYEPQTPSVYKRPLLIVPPWINKYYILDLNAEKSLIRYMVEQGLTVFVVSWVNPDARLRQKTFEDYMREGILASLEVIEDITGETDVSALGYCVGGTLLAVTLAYMARTGDRRITSATFLATQTDFTDPGDLKVFVDENQIRSIEASMAEKGYLDGSQMATAFNMLRPNDLIWAFVVNNYMRGKAPMPFDLLTWNSDATRMTPANHSYYLRNCYLENNLTKGKMVIGGERLDLSQVTIPIYNLATREDHIAPAKSVFRGAKYFGGEMRYVLAGSGHIAGVVNPPDKKKYQFWTGPRPHGEFEDWLQQATETKGSWWPDWLQWLTAQAPDKVDASTRAPGGGKHEPICDAPGDYVRVKC